jgi:hypothetical protein
MQPQAEKLVPISQLGLAVLVYASHHQYGFCSCRSNPADSVSHTDLPNLAFRQSKDEQRTSQCTPGGLLSQGPLYTSTLYDRRSVDSEIN